MSLSRRNRRMIQAVGGGEILPYRDLPKPAQLAIAWYMAADGEAWEIPEEYQGLKQQAFREEFPKMLPMFVERYGANKFGYVEIPTAVLTAAVFRNQHIQERFGSFEEYHQWYADSFPVPTHPARNRWPVILSDYDDDTLQDGWHRFHAYVRQDARMIPAVWFA